MIPKKMSALIGPLLFCQMGVAKSTLPKVIYGADSRYESVAATKKATLQNKRAVAMMVQSGELEEVQKDLNLFRMKKPNFSSTDMLCEEEAFKNQMAVGSCSGFLIAPDLLVTAGHCVNTEADCLDNAWVFGHEYSEMHNEGFSLHLGKDIARCVEVLEAVMPTDSSAGWDKRDYALLRLDRAITLRPPVKVRDLSTHTLKPKDRVYMIGHPAGLPMKITEQGEVKMSAYRGYFWANLDAVGGNSGSAVFNEETHEVEGILVYGQNDYSYDYQRLCMKEARCDAEAGCAKMVEPPTIPEFPRLSASQNFRAKVLTVRDWGKETLSSVLDTDRTLVFERVTKIHAIPNLEEHMQQSFDRLNDQTATKQ